MTELDWQPIETAPKSGERVFLSSVMGGERSEAHFMRWAHIRRNPNLPGTVGTWAHPSGHYVWDYDYLGAPTHWRPLGGANDG